MKYILALLFLTGCNLFTFDDLEVGTCVIRGSGKYVLEVDKVLETGYILKYDEIKYNETETKLLYRSKNLINSEYSKIDCRVRALNKDEIEI